MVCPCCKIEEKLVEFKQQAFEHAKKFSIEKIVPLYEEAYEKALLAERHAVVSYETRVF